MDNFSKKMIIGGSKRVEEISTNQTFVVIICLVLAAYSAKISQGYTLPTSLYPLFDNILAKIITFIVIIIISQFNKSIALMLILSYILLLISYYKQNGIENFQDFFYKFANLKNIEKFENVKQKIKVNKVKDNMDVKQKMKVNKVKNNISKSRDSTSEEDDSNPSVSPGRNSDDCDNILSKDAPTTDWLKNIVFDEDEWQGGYYLPNIYKGEKDEYKCMCIPGPAPIQPPIQDYADTPAYTMGLPPGPDPYSYNDKSGEVYGKIGKPEVCIPGKCYAAIKCPNGFGMKAWTAGKTTEGPKSGAIKVVKEGLLLKTPVQFDVGPVKWVKKDCPTNSDGTRDEEGNFITTPIQGNIVTGTCGVNTINKPGSSFDPQGYAPTRVYAGPDSLIPQSFTYACDSETNLGSPNSYSYGNWNCSDDDKGGSGNDGCGNINLGACDATKPKTWDSASKQINSLGDSMYTAGLTVEKTFVIGAGSVASIQEGTSDGFSLLLRQVKTEKCPSTAKSCADACPFPPCTRDSMPYGEDVPPKWNPYIPYPVPEEYESAKYTNDCRDCWPKG